MMMMMTTMTMTMTMNAYVNDVSFVNVERRYANTFR
jgi:hypothetical protein